MKRSSLALAIVLVTAPLAPIDVSVLARQATPQVEPQPETATTEPLPLPRYPYSLRQGAMLFHHYCSTCHGEIGRGDGFNAYSLDPKPRDLTTAEFQESRTDEDLTAVIRTGGGAVGLSSAMPPWGRTLDARQIHQLVSFVRSLPARAEQTGGGR